MKNFTLIALAAAILCLPLVAAAAADAHPAGMHKHGIIKHYARHNNWVADRREDARDRREDYFDRLEDRYDRWEDRHDTKLDVEDIYDRMEDVRDRREDYFDRLEDRYDRRR